MPDFFQTPRYQLPDEWEVIETMCVKITIPADQQYYGQLIGLLDTLKWSKNFAPDATRTGAATVSRTWQKALDSTPIEVEGCDMPEFRIDPETCLLEVNCSEDPENPDWQPVPTQAYDPRTDGTYPPPFPDPDPSDQCLASATVAEYVWFAGNAFANQLDDAIGAPFIVLVMSIISGLFTLLTDLVIDATATLFTQIDPDTILADWATIDKQDFIDLLVCHLNPDGTVIISEWGDFLNELLVLGATNQAWYLVHYICGLMGVGGVSLAGAMGGVTTADCAPCDDCPERLVWDFEELCPSYEIYYGVHSAVDGNPDGCIEGTTIAGAPWRKSAAVKMTVADEGTITEVQWQYIFDNVYPYNTPSVGIYRGETELYFSIVGVTDSGAWRTYTLSGLSVNVLPGDYVIIHSGYNAFASEAEADASYVRIDNCEITPRALFT